VEYQDELELNMTAMDFRLYDNALGRFHGVDLLAEVDYSGSPYSFGFNNPVYFSDPSGLFPSLEAAMGHINQYGLANATVSFGDVGWIVSNGGYNFFQDSNGTMWLNYVSNDGVNFEKLNGGGGGGSFNSGGFGSSNAGGFASSNNVGFGSSNNGGFDSSVGGGGNSIGNLISSGLWAANTGLGFASLNVANRSQYHLMNEAYHKFKTKQIAYFWQKRFKTLRGVRTMQTNKLASARNLATKLGKASGVLLIADIGLSGNVKPSHGINTLMIAASFTGVGAVAASAWFIADFGTLGYNYFVNGQAKGLGDMLDESEWGKRNTIHLYDGFY
jgi:RHS repeat-associated protein